jgi:hypothetical protein
MTKIGVLGDLHGRDGWLTRTAIPFYKANGISKIVQVGDFGIWPGGSGHSFAKRVNAELEAADMTIYVTPGNHDDYDQINDVPVQENGWQYYRDRILLAPRGHRWEWEGRSFVSLGGAPSVDRTWRLEDMGIGGINGYVENPEDAELPRRGKSWWPEEMITREDVDRTVAGGYADIMIGHDAPIIEGIDSRISGNPHGFNPRDLHYAAQGRALMHEAAAGVMPKLFFAGHYHFFVDEVKTWYETDTGYVSGGAELGETRVIVWDTDYTHRSVGWVDLDTLDVHAGLHT